MKTTSPLLEVLNLEFSYAEGEASLFGTLSFDIAEGRSIGVVGDNGTGKSTLLKIISSLIRPRAGEVRYRGSAINENLKAYRRVVNYSAGAPMGFYPRLTGVENLRFFSAMKNKMLTGPEAIELMDKVGLSGVPTKKYHQYSLGMKQRLHMARLFLEPCEILILDEPTNGLSVEGTDLLVNLLNQDLASKAKLIVSHDARFLEQVTKQKLHLKYEKETRHESAI